MSVFFCGNTADMAWCDLFRYPPKQTYFQRQLNTSKEFRKKVFDGERDVLTGVEVSAMSDATLADPRDALGENGCTVTRGELVEFVDGDTEVLYRR